MRANPTLYQIDTRDWLYRIGRDLNRPATLDDVPESHLSLLKSHGFDWVWLLGVWQTGQLAIEISRTNEPWQQSFREAIPDLQPQDVAGSIFAIQAYTVHSDFGGNAALARLRRRLRAHGICLMLGFVPNHTAIDHPWASAHPDYYVPASEAEPDPRNYILVNTNRGPLQLAHGRDPNFPGWPDTLQLNYGNPEVQTTMIKELAQIATMCDGVRCDMAMLLLPDVYRRTWNIDIQPFWPRAIAAARAITKNFLLMAEVYWGLEWELQQLGFDYTYDKELYDRLHHGDAASVRGHLTATPEYQSKSVRCLENHDEPRATQVFGEKHKAAAIITYLVRGMRFFHDGQLAGFRLRPSVHLRHRWSEDPDPDIATFYHQLLQLLKDDIYQSDWKLLEVNGTSSIICFQWQTASRTSTIAVNYSAQPAHGTLQTPPREIDLEPWSYAII